MDGARARQKYTRLGGRDGADPPQAAVTTRGPHDGDARSAAGDGMEEVRERLIEAEAARWRADAALEGVRLELDRALAEYDALLRSRAYRYLVQPLQRGFNAG